MSNIVTSTIQKTNFSTCYDDWVIELPLLSLCTHTITRDKVNSLYILLLNSGLHPQQVEFKPDSLEKINKYWDICISKNLDYMNFKLE